MKRTRQMHLTSWVFGAANSTKKIIEALLSRFLVLEIPDYSFEEFIQITIKRLEKEKVDKHMATIIAEKVWYELDSSDVRDVIKIGRFVDNIPDISLIIKMMKNKR